MVVSKRRIVVTGLGALTALGLDTANTWREILAGSNGAKPITRFDVSEYPVRFAANIDDFDITQHNISAKEARKLDRFIQYGIVAAEEAIADAKLTANSGDPNLIGVSIGSGIGGIGTIETCYDALQAGGSRKVSPFFIPASIINMTAGHVSMRHGFKGLNISNTAACTTGAHSIGLAARLIERGDADVMVAGGSEAATTLLGLNGFAAARALSRRNDEPEKASRPFDKDRNGFVMGEGAGVLVLEEYEHAKARGATIYAELAGFGMSADAYHITSPSEDGDGAVRCMQAALKDAGLKPTEIDYINAHGTSTEINDRVETIAIKRVFAEHAYKLAVSSTKSMIGHLLGAAGAVEAVFSVLSIRDQVAPPTINLDNPDTEDGCDLDYVPHKARKMKINAVLSNSFGFGGTNGSLLFKKL